MKKTIKWGILGTGNIAHKFAEGLRNVNYAEIFAVGSRNLNTALEFGSHYNISRAYGSYEGLSKDQDVDVIYIATPHNLHFSNTMMCLNNGKHVLCEKPFAVNGFEVRQMIQKAREKIFLLIGS
ncbi:MAG: Gfo/Idh/MocA family oxidoreductase [Chloroflexia bacterium]|nr:Gfo/Idh/MocA family oxidoreductase [Chloroflexia bacterium]